MIDKKLKYSKREMKKSLDNFHQLCKDTMRNKLIEEDYDFCIGGKHMKIYLDQHGTLPTRAHITDAGLDLYSPGDYTIAPGMTLAIDTGVHVELPEKTVGFIKSRSSMFKAGILTDGTIDEGYSGAIGVMLYNSTASSYMIRKGDRIAQLVILPIFRPALELQDKPLTKTARGENGFGSTGR